MFETKYTVSILNSKWEIVKSNLKLKVIPRQDEYIYLDEKYLNVLKVIHMLNEKQDIFIVIDELFEAPTKTNLIDNQLVIKLEEK
jgi:hypothetical protein